jgi:hypothetical protein
MPFATILARWRSGGRSEDVDRCERALRVFKAKHPQLFLNLDKDPQVSQKLREELLGHLPSGCWRLPTLSQIGSINSPSWYGKTRN